MRGIWLDTPYVLRRRAAAAAIGLVAAGSEKTRKINSLRRFHPLVRNATPAGSARPPFVQLFASSTGRPIYCQSRYTGSRARRYLLAGKRATDRPFAGRIDVSAIAIAMRANPRHT